MPLSQPLATWRWWQDAETQEERMIFVICLGLMVSFLGALLVLSSGIAAPYGRYTDTESEKSAWLKLFSSCKIFSDRTAWIIQEMPCVIAASTCLATASPECVASPGNMLLLLCFSLHYVNRAIIYPLRSKPSSRLSPLPIMLAATAFCSMNGFAICRSLTRYIHVDVWASSTLPGVTLWFLGLYLNTDADHILRNLRKPGETGYKIPHGGLFEYVSGANFTAEILEWMGFAIAMGGAVPGVMFSWCTFCNIFPRAVAHHKWYLEKFRDEYPKDRKAVIPFFF